MNMERTTILIEAPLHRHIRALARAAGRSVSDLIRSALRERYAAEPTADRLEAVREIREMETPVGDWRAIEREIASARRRG